MSIAKGFQKIKRYRKTDSGYRLQSQWTSSETVEMEDGNSLEHNLGNIKGITDSFDDDSNIALSSKAGRILADQIAALNGSLSALGNIRYNIETDMVQLFNGTEWVDWKSGEQTNLICFPTDEHNIVFASNIGNTSGIKFSYDINSVQMSSSIPAGGTSRACYLMSANGKNVDLSLYRKLIINASVNNTSPMIGQYACVCYLPDLQEKEEYLNNYKNLYKLNADNSNIEIDISSFTYGFLGFLIRKENDSNIISLNCTKFTLVK